MALGIAINLFEDENALLHIILMLCWLNGDYYEMNGHSNVC